MTPTLALAVEREAAIHSFKPESFYTVILNCNGVNLSSERIDDKEKAEALADECNLIGEVLIIDASKKEKQEKAPALLILPICREKQTEDLDILLSRLLTILRVCTRKSWFLIQELIADFLRKTWREAYLVLSQK